MKIYKQAQKEHGREPTSNEMVPAKRGRPRYIDEEHLDAAVRSARLVQLAGAGSADQPLSAEGARILENSKKIALEDAAAMTAREHAPRQLSKRTLSRYKRQLEGQMNKKNWTAASGLESSTFKMDT